MAEPKKTILRSNSDASFSLPSSTSPYGAERSDIGIQPFFGRGSHAREETTLAFVQECIQTNYSNPIRLLLYM